MTENIYPKYKLNNNDLLVAVRIEDLSGNPVNYDNFLDIEFTFYNSTTNAGISTSTTKTLSFRECKLIDYTAMRLSTHKNFNDSTLCLDLDNIELGGYF